MDHDISHGVLYVALASLNTSAMENVKLALTRIRREKRREEKRRAICSKHKTGFRFVLAHH
jgi:hypothetical protein